MITGKTIFEIEKGMEKIRSEMLGLLPVTDAWTIHTSHGPCKVKDVHYNASENKLYVYLKLIEDEEEGFHVY